MIKKICTYRLFHIPRIPLLITVVLAPFLWTAGAYGQEYIASSGQPYPSLADIHWISPQQQALQPLADWLLAFQKHETSPGNFPGHIVFFGPLGGDYRNIAATLAAEGKAAFLADSSQIHQWMLGEAALPEKENGQALVLFVNKIYQWIPRLGKNTEASYRRLAELPQQGVVLIGDALWPSQMPARFEYQNVKFLELTRPGLAGRKSIFAKELSNYQVSQEVTVKTLAEQTPGYHVQDIRELCRAAAAKATAQQRTAIQLADFDAVQDEWHGGNQEESYSKRIATLLAAQAVVAHYRFRTPFVEYVTVESTGTGDWGHISHEDLRGSGRNTEDLISFFLAGDVASQLFFGESTYAAWQSTASAEVYAGRVMRVEHPDYRSFTLQRRERIIQEILSEQRQSISALLREKKEEVEKVASALTAMKTLTRSEIEDLLKN